MDRPIRSPSTPYSEHRLATIHEPELRADGRYRCRTCGWRGDLSGAIAHVVARQYDVRAA